ncbi:phosphotransferase enzyme family protein [Lederbergia wuyishanensis]|uniref:Ser/Thr protein kinase RdoA (MazF antagonist) n=1 Tax=Lederbergia wuyishanensis TaxID=1347903 RepID=A0ABU0D0D4_9BACI|nr:aminoglycoside phosphotransferase family protein [Lederbergia wuyishanensis]MCJ8006491.1 aminoglycoside phosphotransferase family protein [Lederbergia wuyishanensis]MDQ0341867.1 Ser/Thr protein kinase RdoA (MazF antagonist) [Lederbergia wuyishanensis]
MISIPVSLVNMILQDYEIHAPQVSLIRHNENLTYKVIDPTINQSYLLRIHYPFTKNIEGIQHAKEGILCELALLQKMADETDLVLQTPVRTSSGQLISKLFLNGYQPIYCSLLNWIEGRNLQNEDFSDCELVAQLGEQLARMHKYFKTLKNIEILNSRPHYSRNYNEIMLEKIFKGLEKGLFELYEYDIIVQTIDLIHSRLFGSKENVNDWGIIHGDLNMGNILVTDKREIAFIDFGLFGFGHYLLDVAMGALNSTSETRDIFLNSYFGNTTYSKDILLIVEGFMLISIIFYYANHMENVEVHQWIKERMPLFCKLHCKPFLNGESILYNF